MEHGAQEVSRYFSISPLVPADLGIQETIFPPPSIFYESLRFQWQDLDLFIAFVFGAQWHGPTFHGMEKETTDIASLFTLYRGICLVARAGHLDDPTGILTIEDKAYHFAQYCLLHTMVLKAIDPRDKVYAIFSFFRSFFRYAHWDQSSLAQS